LNFIANFEKYRNHLYVRMIKQIVKILTLQLRNC